MTKTIGRKPDIWLLARLPHDAEKDEIFKGLAQLQKEGLFGYVGASELKRETLEVMQKVRRTPLTFDTLHSLLRETRSPLGTGATRPSSCFVPLAKSQNRSTAK